MKWRKTNKAKKIDSSCRNHGSCPWCKGNNDGEHYDMTDTNRSPPQKLAQTVMCPGEGCVINNKCARFVVGEYSYPVFGTTPHQLPQGGCNYFLEKSQ